MVLDTGETDAQGRCKLLAMDFGNEKLCRDTARTVQKLYDDEINGRISDSEDEDEDEELFYEEEEDDDYEDEEDWEETDSDSTDTDEEMGTREVPVFAQGVTGPLPLAFQLGSRVPSITGKEKKKRKEKKKDKGKGKQREKEKKEKKKDKEVESQTLPEPKVQLKKLGDVRRTFELVSRAAASEDAGLKVELFPQGETHRRVGAQYGGRGGPIRNGPVRTVPLRNNAQRPPQPTYVVEKQPQPESESTSSLLRSEAQRIAAGVAPSIAGVKTSPAVQPPTAQPRPTVQPSPIAHVPPKKQPPKPTVEEQRRPTPNTNPNTNTKTNANTKTNTKTDTKIPTPTLTLTPTPPQPRYKPPQARHPQPPPQPTPPAFIFTGRPTPGRRTSTPPPAVPNILPTWLDEDYQMSEDLFTKFPAFDVMKCWMEEQLVHSCVREECMQAQGADGGFRFCRVAPELVLVRPWGKERGGARGGGLRRWR